MGYLSDIDSPPVVQWQFSFNAWDLLACEIATVCSEPHLVANVVVGIINHTSAWVSGFRYIGYRVYRVSGRNLSSNTACYHFPTCHHSYLSPASTACCCSPSSLTYASLHPSTLPPSLHPTSSQSTTCYNCSPTSPHHQPSYQPV